MHQSSVTTLYFENLWIQARNQLAAGTITAADMQNGQTVPIHYCLSTVARVIQQPNAPSAAIEKLIKRLRGAVGDQFFYRPESWHISLLGCTPRVPDKTSFESVQIARIRDCCHQVLTGNGAIQMHLNGVGLVGNQVFIQVFPQDDQWAALRQRLETALAAVGEQPISYADKRPIHMNIMRITDSSPDALAKLLNALDELRTVDIGLFTVGAVEYAITDFVLSDLSVMETFNLA